MTKKHFIKLAASFKERLDDQCFSAEQYEAMIVIIDEAVQVIKDACPNFDVERFYKACGVTRI